MMISRKGQKTINEGVVGKYIKKDTPPDLPSRYYVLDFINLTLKKLIDTSVIINKIISFKVLEDFTFLCFSH